ncbi:MAG TPA: hypothetical protein VF177_17385 [Anaerolineae bacterium]
MSAITTEGPQTLARRHASYNEYLTLPDSGGIVEWSDEEIIVHTNPQVSLAEILMSADSVPAAVRDAYRTLYYALTGSPSEEDT